MIAQQDGEAASLLDLAAAKARVLWDYVGPLISRLGGEHVCRAARQEHFNGGGRVLVVQFHHSLREQRQAHDVRAGVLGVINVATDRALRVQIE